MATASWIYSWKCLRAWARPYSGLSTNSSKLLSRPLTLCVVLSSSSNTSPNSSRGNISSATQLPFGRELFKGYAHSITDLDQDFNKDVVLTTRASDGDPSMYFEVLQINANTNQYEKRMEYAAPVAAHYGQSVFADFGL